MSHENAAELTGIEQLLSNLKPTANASLRDRILFESGRRAARRSWAWPVLSTSLASAACCLAWLAYSRPLPEPIVVVKSRTTITQPPLVVKAEAKPSPPLWQPIETPAQAPEPLADNSYWRLRERVLRDGIEALPALVHDKSDGPEYRPSEPLTVRSQLMRF